MPKPPRDVPLPARHAAPAVEANRLNSQRLVRYFEAGLGPGDPLMRRRVTSSPCRRPRWGRPVRHASRWPGCARLGIRIPTVLRPGMAEGHALRASAPAARSGELAKSASAPPSSAAASPA
jgi:hypothetical protein